MTKAVNDWIASYRRAWDSNDPSDIRALFTDDATYCTEPFAPPSRGIEAILATWLEKKDEPGDTTFTWHELVVTDDVTIVQGETVYKGGPSYSNLWVIRFDGSGKATEFTEWWMDHGTLAST